MQLTTTFNHVPLNMLGIIQAGFPSAAEEELADTLSLDQYLITNPSASFMFKANNESMNEAGIYKDDLLIVERGRKPSENDIMLVSVDNEWQLTNYTKRENFIMQELIIIGVVVAVVRKYH